MTHQEKKLANLRADYETVKAKLDKAMELIEQYTSRIEQLEESLHAVKADREFLLSQIKQHRNTLQHPTSVDLQLYASARDVIRNPSK
jgi:chromosome segregation ATPase